MTYASIMNGTSSLWEPESSPVPANADAPAAGDRRTRRRQRTREALISAGERLFATQGYHGTTVAEIAGAADVGVGTFYLHFRDKDDLAETIVREGLLTLRATLGARLRDVPPHERPTLLLSDILSFAKSRPELFCIALTTSGTMAITLQAQSWLAGEIADALAGRGDDSVPIPEDLRLTGRLIAGMVTQAIVWWADHDEPGPEQMAGRILSLVAGPQEA
jgi:AcrR family transcriptional regulator